MEKHKKLNIASLVLLILSIIISVYVNYICFKPALHFKSIYLSLMLFFLPPVLLLISLISSITSVIMKKNKIGIILIIVVVLAFIPLCYLQIFAILCGITGYHG